MMLRGMYSMITRAYGHSFHNSCYEMFGMGLAVAEAGAPPQAAWLLVPYTPSLVTAQNSRRYE